MNHHDHLPVLRETGFVLLDPDPAEIDASEWRELTYLDWIWVGGLRFAPLASATGAMDCNGFWESVPPRADKDGVWIESQRRVAPTLVRRVEAIGARAGRCRVVELQPNSYEEALQNLHLDPNNRLNPDGEGWVVRSFMQLTDDPDSWMLLRTDAADPATETRIPLPAGARIVVDSQRLWHAVWHAGDQPRYVIVLDPHDGDRRKAHKKGAHARSVCLHWGSERSTGVGTVDSLSPCAAPRGSSPSRLHPPQIRSAG